MPFIIDTSKPPGPRKPLSPATLAHMQYDYGRRFQSIFWGHLMACAWEEGNGKALPAIDAARQAYENNVDPVTSATCLFALEQSLQEYAPNLWDAISSSDSTLAALVIDINSSWLTGGRLATTVFTHVFTRLFGGKRRGRPLHSKAIPEAQFRQRYPAVYQECAAAYASLPKRHEIAEALCISIDTFGRYLIDYGLPFPPF